MKYEDYNENENPEVESSGVENVEEPNTSPERIINPETATDVAKNTGVDTKTTVDDLEKIDKADEKKKKKLKRKVLIRNIIIGFLLVVIIILLLRSCGKDNDLLINRVFNTETNEFVEPEVKKSERIDIPVVIDALLTADAPYMSFYNPDTNADKFYLKYELHSRNDDSLLWESEMVEPGQKFSADIYNALGGVEGTYYAYVKVRTFEFNTLTERNGTSNNVIITIQ